MVYEMRIRQVPNRDSNDWSNPEDDNKLAGAPNNEEINSLSTSNRKDGQAPTYIHTYIKALLK